MFEIINQSSQKIVTKNVQQTLHQITSYFKTKKVRQQKYLDKNITVVFLDLKEAKKINLKHRQKNYATDILSFAPLEESSLGELILCPQVIARQAKEHGLTADQELTYMLIHGVLHLLGYDHEKTSQEKRIMYKLQDELFDRFISKPHSGEQRKTNVHSRRNLRSQKENSGVKNSLHRASGVSLTSKKNKKG